MRFTDKVNKISCLMASIAVLATGLAMGEPLKPDRPRGIFVLSGLGGAQGGTEKSRQIIGQVRNLDYVEGVTIGFSWADTEPSPGQYDFSKADAALAALQTSGKKLNVEVFAVEVPEHVVARLPDSEIWESHAPGRRTVKTAVPWSQTTQQAWKAYMKALADHPVSLPDGTKVRFSEHPALMMLDSPVVGLQGIRDLSKKLTALPGYDRKRFVDSVMESVHATRDAFPSKFGFLGFFRMDDSKNSPPLEQEIMDRLMAEFNGPGQPSLGFFQETLSDSIPRADGLGKYLSDAKDRTYIVFQAKTAWSRPFTGAETVSSGKAAVGIQFAYETYKATYVEIYLPDVLDPAQTESLRKWNDILMGRNFPEKR